MKTNPSPASAVALLNGLLEHAGPAVSSIFAMRAVVADQNDWLRNHPTIQAGVPSLAVGNEDADDNDGTLSLGVLGILNGIFGADENSVGYIGMIVSDDHSEVLEFYVLDKEQRRKMVWRDEGE